MANVNLSGDELAVVTNADLILTKNRIIQKVYDLLGEVSEAYTELSKGLDPEILHIPPKISRGENYLGLPWVMLDHPRKFSSTDVIAVRSFFWWGKFFSITLQLQGDYLERYTTGISTLKDKDWWICTNRSDAWQHHFDDGHYIPFTDETSLDALPFIKLAKKIPLEEWDNVFDFFTGSFKEIVGVLSAQAVK